MKTTKRFLLVALGFLTLFMTVSCTENNTLDSFIAELNSFNDSEIISNDNSLESNDGFINVLSFKETASPVIELSDTQNDLITFNELRLQVIDLHDQIAIEKEKIKDTSSNIREIVSILKEKNYILLEEDITILRNNITELKTMRQDLLDTRGDAYQRIYDLRGSYTRDNLPNIITVYQEVIEVLEYRLETFKEANILLEDSMSLLNDYLES